MGERESWWEFVGRRESRSPGYQRFLADGLTRMLVAAAGAGDQRPHRRLHPAAAGASTSRARAGSADRLLDGPTSDVWIDPWVEHLRAAGVDLRTDTEVDGIDCRGGRIAGVTVDHHGTQRDASPADHYVAGDAGRAAAPAAQHAAGGGRSAPGAATRRLRTRWMNGIMFYLHHDVPCGRGPHDLQRLRLGADLDLPAPVLAAHRLRGGWATGTVGGVLSVDVSDWERAVAAQRARSPRSAAPTRSRPRCGRSSRTTLNDPARTSSSTTPTSRAPSSTRTSPSPNPSAAANAEPLLINTAGSLGRSPRGGDAACRTSSSPRTSCAPTPTSRRWRAPTRRRGGR